MVGPWGSRRRRSKGDRRWRLRLQQRQPEQQLQQAKREDNYSSRTRRAKASNAVCTCNICSCAILARAGGGREHIVSCCIQGDAREPLQAGLFRQATNRLGWLVVTILITEFCRSACEGAKHDQSDPLLQHTASVVSSFARIFVSLTNYITMHALAFSSTTPTTCSAFSKIAKTLALPRTVERTPSIRAEILTTFSVRPCTSFNCLGEWKENSRWPFSSSAVQADDERRAACPFCTSAEL